MLVMLGWLMSFSPNLVGASLSTLAPRSNACPSRCFVTDGLNTKSHPWPICSVALSPASPEISPDRATRCLSRSQRSEEHTSELQSLRHLVCRLLLEKK